MERVSPVVTQQVGEPVETRTQVFCRLVQAAFPSVLPPLSSPKQSEPVSKHLFCAAHMSMCSPTLWLLLMGSRLLSDWNRTSWVCIPAPPINACVSLTSLTQLPNL